MKQKDGVYRSICDVLGQSDFTEKVALTAEQKTQVYEQVTQGISQGEIDFSESATKKHTTEEDIMRYVKGLVNNWLRKDPRLNGGVAYVAKNPGSRAGQGDAMLRELRKLRKLNIDDEEKVAEIDAYISTRQEEIKSKKSAEVNINTDLIPEALRHMV